MLGGLKPLNHKVVSFAYLLMRYFLEQQPDPPAGNCDGSKREDPRCVINRFARDTLERRGIPGQKGDRGI